MAKEVIDMNRIFISMNLDFIEDQRSHLHEAIDDYVNKVTRTGRAWAFNTQNRQSTFSEISEMIKMSVTFLSSKYEEINNESMPLEASARMRMTDDEDHVAKNSNRSFKLASTGTKSKLELNVDSEQEAGINFKKSKKLKQELKHDGFQSVSQMQEDINEKQRLANSRHADLEQKLQSLSEKHDQIDYKLHIEVNVLKKEIESLKNNIDLANDETAESVKDHSLTLARLELATSNLSENVAKINAKLQSLSAAQQDNVVMMKKVDGIEERLVQMEVTEQNAQTRVEEHMKELGTNYKILCQLLNKRLQPLEKLRGILNDKAKAHDDNIKQLHALVTKMAVVSTSIRKLEVMCPKQLVGFSAEAVIKEKLDAHSIIRPFKLGICSADLQFDSSTGVFTASHNGVYMAYISVYLYEKSPCFVYLVHKQMMSSTNSIFEHRVSWAQSEISGAQPRGTGTNSCCTSLVQMKAGDYLVPRIGENCKIGQKIIFSCYRVG